MLSFYNAPFEICFDISNILDFDLNSNFIDPIEDKYISNSWLFNKKPLQCTHKKLLKKGEKPYIELAKGHNAKEIYKEYIKTSTKEMSMLLNKLNYAKSEVIKNRGILTYKFTEKKIVGKY